MIKMKIAILSEKYPPDPGGLAVSTQRLASLLQREGNQVEVFAPQQSLQSGCTYSVQDGGVIVNRFAAQRRVEDTLADWFDLVIDRHGQQSFDLLHGFYLVQAGFVATYAGNYLNLPSVVSARGNDLDRSIFHPGKAAHILYALQYSSAITANAWQLVRKAQALAPGKTVAHIPNGVDSAIFCPGERDENLISHLELDHRLVIGFSGEARAKKGLATQLLAFEQVAAQREVALLLVGGVRKGEDQDLLNIFCKQKPSLNIKVLPFVPLEQMPAYYRLMDVFWMPSLRDGMPNALLEAMACERPVVGTPVGGIRDLLNQPEIGRLVAAGDVSALAELTVRLLDNPKERISMGRAARDWVCQNYSPETELCANLQIYQQALKAYS
jgi:phosphatidylinositol alpha-1,6-mannosyltransferase